MEDYLLTIIFLAIIGALFMAWYFSHKSKAEERKLLIEKGFSPSDLPQARKFNFPWLKGGIFLTTTGLGFIIVAIIIKSFIGGISDGAGTMVMIFLVGLGLLASHFLPKKLKGNTKDEN